MPSLLKVAILGLSFQNHASNSDDDESEALDWFKKTYGDKGAVTDTF